MIGISVSINLLFSQDKADIYGTIMHEIMRFADRPSISVDRADPFCLRNLYTDNHTLANVMTAKRDEMAPSSLLERYPIVMRLPIQWGDLDANGHVNSIVYLKWFEAARAVYATRVGVEIVAREQGVGGVLASIACKYQRPLDYPGDVLSGVRMARVSVGSLTLECLIADARTGVPVADATCDVVLYDYATNSPVPVPQQIHNNIEKLEKKSFPR